MSDPIVSLLDMDFYKFTMGQFVFVNYPRTQVKYAFKCRTAGARLANFIPLRHIMAELDRARALSFSKSELSYLKSIKNGEDKEMFSEDYLRFLSNFQLPPYRIDISGDDLTLEFAGPWHQQIYWETIALSIVNQLYKENRGMDREDAEQRLVSKAEVLGRFPDIKFSDFGTRRRHSREWHEHVIDTIHNLPGYLGTSNVFLSRLYGTRPIGTLAHELIMVVTASELKYARHAPYDTLVAATVDTIFNWARMYGVDSTIALTDTYGSNIFFSKMFEKLAWSIKGLRQDSGNPYQFARRAIDHYSLAGIDPKTKTLVFSDGLELVRMMSLHKNFAKEINVVFGWGTNLTNDTTVDPLSIVVKPAEADGEPCVKLSDNIQKATGPKVAIEQYKKLIDYKELTNEECKY